MKLSTSLDFKVFVEGFAYGKLMEYYNIRYYPTRLQQGVFLFQKKYSEICNVDYKISLTREEFENTFSKDIGNEFNFHQSDFLHTELQKIKHKNCKINPKGSRTLSYFESKYINKYYMFNNQMFQIKHIKENDTNRDKLTIETSLKSGKKYVYRILKKEFLLRSFYSKI